MLLMSISKEAKYSYYSGGFKILCSVRSQACAVGCFAVFQDISLLNYEALPGGGSHVARLNFKMSRVSFYKCLSLIVSFAVTVAIWPREVVSCHHFILCAVATFWAMSLVGIYPGRASTITVECAGTRNISRL